ncbi:unnamed protein product [Vitrella brassicaformis CCMP3155]|uniref:Uncharacterized protein n=1 Tax=Vitrella brassicaformis (strain CCMP3155) TaxID=1169540 RepID=A0A0G4F8F9_VITBC|nr:unnamed protein product [Vitrella brassicaformis CCMP3155]|eukprot:CEM09014.1 unnamed protein product [Vitrella brassicaformis CCMP3155]
MGVQLSAPLCPCAKRSGKQRNREDESFICSCFLTHGYFLKARCVHIDCPDDSSWRDLEPVVREELERQRQHRIDCIAQAPGRIHRIRERYRPRDAELFDWSDGRWLHEACIDVLSRSGWEAKGRGRAVVEQHRGGRFPVVSMPVFSDEFLRRFADELTYFRSLGLHTTKPNSMNDGGVLMREMGMDAFFDGLLADVLTPTAHRLHLLPPDATLDSHKTFTEDSSKRVTVIGTLE